MKLAEPKQAEAGDAMGTYLSTKSSNKIAGNGVMHCVHPVVSDAHIVILDGARM